jgi:hypothetical protein
MSNIDRVIPVIRVFRRRNFPLPNLPPIVENQNLPNLSPDHHSNNNSDMDESDHDTDHENGPFYYSSDSDEYLGNGELVDEPEGEERANPLNYVDPRTKIEKDSLFNMQFPCKIGLEALTPTLTRLFQ